MFNFRSRLNQVREAVTATVDRAVGAVERVVARAQETLQSFIPFGIEDSPITEAEILEEIALGLEELESVEAEETTSLREIEVQQLQEIAYLEGELSAEEELRQDLRNLGASEDEVDFLIDRQILPIYERVGARKRPFGEISDVIAYINDGSFPLGYVEGFYYDGTFLYLKVSGE